MPVRALRGGRQKPHGRGGRRGAAEGGGACARSFASRAGERRESHMPPRVVRSALETTSLRLKLDKQVQICIFSNSNACSAKPQRQIF